MSTRQLAPTGAAIAVLASLAAGVAPALAVSRPSCSAGSTLGITKSARAFVVRTAGIRRVYGCSTSTRRVSYLGRGSELGEDRAEGVDTSVVAVSEPRVAYVRNGCSDDGCSETVFVYDLKTRRQRSVAQATPAEQESKVVDIVLNTNGVVGWISEDRVGDPPVAVTRYVIARQPGLFRGIKVIPIATGLDIARGSLALAGNTLYWTQGGVAKAAPLP